MKITVKQLIEDLQKCNPDLEVHFGGLDYVKVKNNSIYVSIEFQQPLHKDADGNVYVINPTVEDFPDYLENPV